MIFIIKDFRTIVFIFIVISTGSILTAGEQQYRNSQHLYLVMVNGIRTGDPCGFNKGRNSKFRVGSRVQQTPEEGRRTYRPKRGGNNNKDEDNSPKTINDKNKFTLFYIRNIYECIYQPFRTDRMCDTRSIFKRNLTGLN